MEIKAQIEKIVSDKLRELLVTPVEPDYITLQKANRTIGISRGLFYKLHNAGKINFYKLAGRTCIKLSELSQIMRVVKTRPPRSG